MKREKSREKESAVVCVCIGEFYSLGQIERMRVISMKRSPTPPNAKEKSKSYVQESGASAVWSQVL